MVEFLNTSRFKAAFGLFHHRLVANVLISPRLAGVSGQDVDFSLDELVLSYAVFILKRFNRLKLFPCIWRQAPRDSPCETCDC